MGGGPPKQKETPPGKGEATARGVTETRRLAARASLNEFLKPGVSSKSWKHSNWSPVTLCPTWRLRRVCRLRCFVQRGGIGDHSVADIARAMYRSGYDFRHFLAGGASVAIIEVFVRTAWTVRELSEGKKLTEALPVASPRLRSGPKNPLSINWAQWMAFFRYLIPQMHWLLIARENTRAVFVQEKLDESWKQLDAELAITWSNIFGSAGPAVL
jgi:hypothetical protein